MKTFEHVVTMYPRIVEQMCSAAIDAGEKIMDVYSRDDFIVETKKDDSPLTLADRLSDDLIMEVLGSKFPEIPIISEESFSEFVTDMYELYFLVDPLDGTKEFIKKTGEFTVNIALIINTKTELGVVYVPDTRELYYRDLNGASYLLEGIDYDGGRGHRTQISCRAVDYENISVVKSLSHSSSETEAYIAQYSPKQTESAGSSLKFGLIARGISDLYPRLGRTMEWDTGAAHAVLKGAGGNVRRLDTLQELSYGKPGMGNPFFVAAGNDMKLIAINNE